MIGTPHHFRFSVLNVTFFKQLFYYFWNSPNFVRCYAWEKSFESRIQEIRNEELSWFRKAQLLSAVWLVIFDFVLPIVNKMHLSRLQIVNRMQLRPKDWFELNSFYIDAEPIYVFHC